MAIIQCPECGNNISDKAKDCIHCGFPIKEQADTSVVRQAQTSYNVTFKGYKSTWAEINGGDAAFGLRQVVGIDFDTGLKIMKNLPQTIERNITFEYANWIKDYFEKKYKLYIEIDEVNESPNLERVRHYDIISGKTMGCPRCGSSDITTGTRGYNIVWGFVGSGKTTNRCGKCGHTWQPGQNISLG